MTSFLSRVRFRRDHRWTPKHMSAYLDGELPASARERVQRHIRDCPECRRVLRGLQRMLGVLDGLAPVGGQERPDIATAVARRLGDAPRE
jgi:anti-sigma factor RsiW